MVRAIYWAGLKLHYHWRGLYQLVWNQFLRPVVAKEATLLIATVLRKGEGFSKCRSGRASVIQLYNSELRTNCRQCKICDARTSTR